MPLSNEELRQRLAAQEWTAHNIRLNSDITTMPGKPDFMETDTRLKAILRILSFIYGDRISGLRVADLGCLEGGFALALAQRGLSVIALEARRSNFEKPLLLKEHFSLANLEVRQEDVKNFTLERFGSFDIVLALGILYHLDRPVDWLHQIAKLTRTVLIIESHYAPADERALKLVDPGISNLSALKQTEFANATYEGRWFHEYAPGADRESMPWAAYSNPSSFWLTKESLMLALMHAGFGLVLEQHDYSAPFHKLLTTTLSRGIFIALKNG